jgi:phytoene dehydrogenase-like protein
LNYQYDSIVVGSGPNGLAAAISLARAELSVLLIEAKDQLGGGLRSAELTLPGFVHDVCSAIHPLAVASPFLRSLPLAKHGLEWIHPPLPLAHPLDGGDAACLDRSLATTARYLGADAPAYEWMMGSLVDNWDKLLPEILQPILHVPRQFRPLFRFGLQGICSAHGLANRYFETNAAKALIAGLAAHSFLPLKKPGSAAFGLMLGAAGHAVGWPMARGGSGKIADALVSHFKQLGGKIETGYLVKNVDELPRARTVLLDISPRQLLAMAGHRFTPGYCDALRRFRPGPGVFKIDYALNHPIPWLSPMCRQAATVHVGGTLEEITFAENQVARGEHPGRPFVLLVQNTLFDPSRAPASKHTAWAYCHVPNGSTLDQTERIEAQIERFAPGFKDCVLLRKTRNCAALENENPNLIGGDISGGANDLSQLIARPILNFAPYRTPAKGLFICSASTPPGGGVHGMCGYNAAQHALKSLMHDRRLVRISGDPV